MTIKELLDKSELLSVMGESRIELFVHPIQGEEFVNVTVPIAAALGLSCTKGRIKLDGWAIKYKYAFINRVNAVLGTNVRIHFACALVGPVVDFADYKTSMGTAVVSQFNARAKKAGWPI